MAHDKTTPRAAFLDTVSMLRSGDALPELDEALQELVAAVKATGKGGALTLKLQVAPANKSNTHMLFVTDTVSVTPPKVDREQTLVYATDDNRLSRRDPRQPELNGLRETADVKAFPREAPTGTTKE